MRTKLILWDQIPQSIFTNYSVRETENKFKTLHLITSDFRIRTTLILRAKQETMPSDANILTYYVLELLDFLVMT